jgi:hypothetical protein
MGAARALAARAAVRRSFLAIVDVRESNNKAVLF